MTQSLVLEPARAAGGDVGARRKGKQDGHFGERWEPFVHVGSDADDIARVCLPCRMLPIHAVAGVARFGPRFDHVGRVIEQADDDAPLSQGRRVGRHGLGVTTSRRRRLGYPQIPVFPLKGIRNYSLGYSLYYSVEAFFRGGRKFASHPLGSFLPTRMAAKGEVIHKPAVVCAELLQLGGGDARILAGGADDALVAVGDGDGDVALVLEGADVGADLAVAHVEELREVAVRGEAAAFVVERVDLDEEHLLHQGEVGGEPDVLRNPHALEVTFVRVGVHRFILPRPGPRTLRGRPVHNCLSSAQEADALGSEPENPFVAGLDLHSDEVLFPQRGQVTSDLPFTDLEQFDELVIGSTTTLFRISGGDPGKQGQLPLGEVRR